MHAAVLHLAQKSRYKHIAVLEDDIIIRHDVVRDGAEIRARFLKSNAWSIACLGFRPYFLENLVETLSVQVSV